MHHHRQGKLVIRPMNARLERDTEDFGKMDPYCKIIIGNQTGRTGVANNAGQNPSWNDAIEFNITDETEIKISVWDYDSTSKDDLVGEAVISSHTLTSHPWEGIIELFYLGRKSGEVRLSSHFTPGNH